MICCRHDLALPCVLAESACLPSPPPTPADLAGQPSRAVSVRRFPTLDSYGSLLDGAASKPPQRIDSLAALAGQRFTNTFAQPPPEQEAAAGAALGAQQAGSEAAGGVAARQAPTGRALRKRQHSSRRTLMAALSRENSAASSLDGLAPPLGKARHILESGGASPTDHELPQLQLQGMHRSGSLLGREASAAAALAEAAAKAFMAAAPGGAPPSDGAYSPMSVASTPSHHLQRRDSFGAGVRGQHPAGLPPSPLPRLPPSSPLHARMTGLKLRSSTE